MRRDSCGSRGRGALTDSLLGVALPDRLLWFVALLVALFFVSSVSLIGTVVVLRVRNVMQLKRWHRLEARWEPAIIDVLVGQIRERELHALVRHEDQRYFVDFLLRYGKRLKGVERETVVRLAQRYLPAIAEQLEGRSPERRARAIRTLGELDAATYTTQIIAALRDHSPLVAITAGRALARRQDPELAQSLVDSLESFELWDTRFLSSLLADLGPKATPVLREVLDDRERPARTRALAAHTLERLNDLNAAHIAVAVLEASSAMSEPFSEERVDLIVAALRLIRKVGRGEHLGPVRRLVESSHAAVRGYAVNALASVGSSADAPLIRPAIDDESSWVVMHAVRGLKTLGELDELQQLAASNHPRADAAREVLAGSPS
jgi:HEAT repeat protein